MILKRRALKMNKEIKVEIGGQSVIIQKLFGPMIFMELRITAVTENCTWKIERLTLMPTHDEQQPQEHIWIEFCRIPGQFDWEFLKDE